MYQVLAVTIVITPLQICMTNKLIYPMAAPEMSRTFQCKR